MRAFSRRCLIFFQPEEVEHDIEQEATEHRVLENHKQRVISWEIECREVGTGEATVSNDDEHGAIEGAEEAIGGVEEEVVFEFLVALLLGVLGLLNRLSFFTLFFFIHLLSVRIELLLLLSLKELLLHFGTAVDED